MFCLQERRREVAELLRELGPHAGLPQLRRTFSDVARCELAELKRAEQRHRRERRAVHAREFRWERVGAVWDISYYEPPDADRRPLSSPLLSPRLGERQQVAWIPVPSATAEYAAAALESSSTADPARL